MRKDYLCAFISCGYFIPPEPDQNKNYNDLKYRILTLFLSILILLQSEALLAQDSNAAMSQGVLWLFIVFMLIAVSLLIGDNMVRAQAKLGGVDVSRDDDSFLPGMSALFGKSRPDFARDGSFFKLNKGHNIKLEGEASNQIKMVEVNTFAVQPPDFRGIAPIPKMLTAAGEEVEAGQALFFDKSNPDIFYVSPVSGEIAEIRRGAKRAIVEVVILADKDQRYRSLPVLNSQTSSRDDIIAYLKEYGFWPYINQRPFDVVADPSITPRDIFISTFDTAPLSPDMNLVVKGKGNLFQAGIDVLTKLTTGDVHLGLDANGDIPNAAFTNAKGVKKHWFSGKHPAGNVGIQIHHIAPIKPNDTVWTLQVEDVILLGDMVLNQRFNPEQLIAVTGNGAKQTHYLQTKRGANLGDLLKSQGIDENENRIICGDVLSGRQSSGDGFLHAHDNQITIIPEGRDYEMFGWLLPAVDRPTVSRTYPNFLFPNLSYEVDTNTHGEPRAFVKTGEYEALMPADIYPQHLMKAIMIEDYEKMEGLGLLELSEEDVALCEFACTSKQPLQKILREGLDLMRDQM